MIFPAKLHKLGMIFGCSSHVCGNRVSQSAAFQDTTMVAACKSSAVLRVTFTRREHHW